MDGMNRVGGQSLWRGQANNRPFDRNRRHPRRDSSVVRDWRRRLMMRMRLVMWALVCLSTAPCHAFDGERDGRFGTNGQVAVIGPRNHGASTSRPTGDLAMLADGRIPRAAPLDDGSVRAGACVAMEHRTRSAAMPTDASHCPPVDRRATSCWSPLATTAPSRGRGIAWRI
ncbi:MAG: hypothetical protein KF903_10345 [Dokdonella sp.]|nr:hypothetical protein [Dokdonella sp.]